jgi:hypothetical protein
MEIRTVDRKLGKRGIGGQDESNIRGQICSLKSITMEIMGIDKEREIGIRNPGAIAETSDRQMHRGLRIHVTCQESHFGQAQSAVDDQRVYVTCFGSLMMGSASKGSLEGLQCSPKGRWDSWCCGNSMKETILIEHWQCAEIM